MTRFCPRAGSGFCGVVLSKRTDVQIQNRHHPVRLFRVHRHFAVAFNRSIALLVRLYLYRPLHYGHLKTEKR